MSKVEGKSHPRPPRGNFKIFRIVPHLQISAILGCRSRIRRYVLDLDQFDVDTGQQDFVRKVGGKLRFTCEYTEISFFAENVP